MVKHGRTKKRRAGRLGKTKLKNVNPLKPKFTDMKVRAKWDPKKPPSVNMANMGFSTSPNAAIESRGLNDLQQQPASNGAEVELFDVPDSDQMKPTTAGKTKKSKKLPLSAAEQRYIIKCMHKHGDDYLAMFRDIKTNDMQYTEEQLRKRASRFLLLQEDQIRVEIPENVKRLMPSSSGANNNNTES